MAAHDSTIPPPVVSPAVAALRDLLDSRAEDVRALDVDGFRAWLERRLEGWRRDEAFTLRARIRDLRVREGRIGEAERRERVARAAYEASPEFAPVETARREMEDAGKAVAGLAGALEAAEEGERERIAAKLRDHRAREAALREEWRRLVASSEARRRLDEAAEALAAIRRETGLGELEERLARTQRERGRRSGRSGARFEDAARAAVERVVLPTFAGGGAGDSLRVLTGVTLGAARMEIDGLVVRLPADGNEPVEVLAMVEAKHNPNDLAHGFRQRQEDLAWLTGEGESYDPAARRTRHFPTGHFDRAAFHTEGGERFRIAPTSFRRFRRDPATGLFLHGLLLATRPGTLWGLGSREMARLSHRAATDERWDLGSEAYLRELRRWALSLAHPLESPDVLRLYGRSEDLARHVLLLP